MTPSCMFYTLDETFFVFSTFLRKNLFFLVGPRKLEPEASLSPVDIYYGKPYINMVSETTN